MPQVTDPEAIRACLSTDPGWTAYALGDLGPQHWPHCTWLQSAGTSTATVLVYRRFETPVLFTHGPIEELSLLLDELNHDRAYYLSVRPEVIQLLESRFHLAWTKAMWRMRLATAPPPANRRGDAEKLGPGDLSSLQRLFADGADRGDGPDFFAASMLEDGVFFGVREEDELVAVAGTHLVVPGEGVAAIGNVYTRFDHRGRGLGEIVTRAVVAELNQRRIPTIVLNVAQENAVAIRLYERLGFIRHVPFCEGLAERRP